MDRLTQEYGINLAIHNHPKPSRYWDPEIVLKAVEGCNPRVGACADTGHWLRSGLNPVECLKKLEGRIISLHFKDLNKAQRDAHDVIWGTGVANVKAMLEELHRQRFAGVFSIEYEHNWENSMPEIAESIKFFRQTAKALGY
jgi:sugar phosphate isomerase/epimerase